MRQGSSEGGSCGALWIVLVGLITLVLQWV